MKRRNAVKSLGFGLGGIFIPNSILSSCTDTKAPDKQEKATHTTVNHSTCRWCYQDIPLEELA